MTISSEYTATLRYGDGVQTVFTFEFRPPKDGGIVVSIVSASGVLTVVSPSEYVVTNLADSGYITFNSIIPIATETIVIERKTDATQLVEVSPQTGYDPKVVGEVWDKLTMLVQELRDGLTRSISFVPGYDSVSFVSALLQAAVTATGQAAIAVWAASDAIVARDDAVNAKQNLFEAFEGTWVTGKVYIAGSLAYSGGSTYLALVSHTSGVFATDLLANKWEIFASQGGTGAGTGDMLAANNLSDLASKPAARGILGLGSLSTITPTGTPNSTTYLRGDGTWGTPVGITPASFSGETAITLDVTHTFTHGLGAMPKKLLVWLECISDSRGWVTGDRIPLTNGTENYNNNVAPAIAVSSTYIKVRFPSQFLRTTGLNGSSRGPLSTSNFKLVVEASL